MTMFLRLALYSALFLLALSSSSVPGLRAQQGSALPNFDPGQSATLLPDGSYLLLGGETHAAEAALYDPSTRTARVFGRLLAPRAWHTATVLPDGTVLIVGGVGAAGQMIALAEQSDPAGRSFTSLGETTFTPRARHSATLLTDGRVLFAGGDVVSGGLAAELWMAGDPSSYPAGTLPRRSRRNATAQLMPDGRVRFTGDAGGDEIFDPATDSFLELTMPDAAAAASAMIAGSTPEDGASDVSVHVQVGVRFALPLDVRSVQGGTVVLEGPPARSRRASSRQNRVGWCSSHRPRRCARPPPTLLL